MKGFPIESKIALVLVGLCASILLANAKEPTSDCQKAIEKAVQADGAVYGWTQWSKYADWTHQEQCSEELAKLD